MQDISNQDHLHYLSSRDNLFIDGNDLLSPEFAVPLYPDPTEMRPKKKKMSQMVKKSEEQE